MIRPFRMRRRGAMTVEFALCAPILFAVIFSIIEFSRAMQLQHSVRQAAFEGARAGVPMDAATSDVTTAATNIANAVGISSPTITIVPNPIAYSSQTVTVTVSTTPRSNGCFIYYFAGNNPISATITLNREVQAVNVAGP
jgi:Flp pilus assembly protein TadG